MTGATLADEVRSSLLLSLRSAHASLARGVRSRQRVSALATAAIVIFSLIAARLALRLVEQFVTRHSDPVSPLVLLSFALVSLLAGAWKSGLLRPVPFDLRRSAEVWDLKLGSEHSMACALEFSLAPASAFELATVEAGARVARQAVLPVVDAELGEPPIRTTLLLVLAAMLAVLLLTPWSPWPSSGALTNFGASDQARAGGDSEAESAAPVASLGTEVGRSAPHASAPPDRASPAKGSESAGADAPGRPEVPPKSGRMGEGMSSAEVRVGAPHAGQGDPSEGAESVPERETARVPPKPPKTSPTTTKKLPPKGKQDAASGATTGQGASGGGAMSPVKSPWTQKDQTEDRALAENSSDESVDEEIGEEEAKSGTQPSTKDRRGATSRDLSISGPGEGGDGRGGPTPQKKARGVGSLILGLPIPDFVRGLLNPGTTKVTYERVPPMPAPGRPDLGVPAVGRAQAEPVRSRYLPTHAMSRTLRQWLLELHR